MTDDMKTPAQTFSISTGDGLPSRDEDTTKFRNRVRIIRSILNITQGQLAQDLDVSTFTISLLECGTSDFISLKMLLALSDLLDNCAFSFNWFFTGKGSPFYATEYIPDATLRIAQADGTPAERLADRVEIHTTDALIAFLNKLEHNRTSSPTTGYGHVNSPLQDFRALSDNLVIDACTFLSRHLVFIPCSHFTSAEVTKEIRCYI